MFDLFHFSLSCHVQSVPPPHHLHRHHSHHLSSKAFRITSNHFLSTHSKRYMSCCVYTWLWLRDQPYLYVTGKVVICSIVSFAIVSLVVILFVSHLSRQPLLTEHLLTFLSNLVPSNLHNLQLSGQMHYAWHSVAQLQPNITHMASHMHCVYTHIIFYHQRHTPWLVCSRLVYRYVRYAHISHM